MAQQDEDELSQFDSLLSKKKKPPQEELDEFDRLTKRPGLAERVRNRISEIGSDDEVSDPASGYTTRRSETRSESEPEPVEEPKRNIPKSVLSKQIDRTPTPMEDLAIDMQSVEPGMPPVRKPGELGKAFMRGTGQVASVAGSAAQTATGGYVGNTARKIGKAFQEEAGEPRVKRMSDIHGVGDAVDYGKRVVGETVPWVGSDVIAGAVGGPLGVYGMQGAIVTGMIREELEAQGITDEPTILKVTAIIGVPAAAAGGALPAMVLRNIVGSAVRKRVVELGLKGAVKLGAKEVAKHVVTGAAGLAAQQGTIYAGTRVLTGKPIDPSELADVVGSSAELGGTAGGLFGGVAVPGHVKEQARVNRSYDADAAALELGVNSNVNTPKLHPDTPAEVAARIARSATANREAAARKAAEPERIIGAAIQVNGNTYTGQIHADAVRAAIDAGDLPKELLNTGMMDATHLDHGAVDGFVTSKGGRFVDRAEAEQIADRADQIRSDRGNDGVPGELDALDLKTDAVPAPKIGEMATMDVHSDPARLQFRTGKDPRTGAGGPLTKVELYREDLAGILTVWRDPADGLIYIVNGHHRLDLAKRSGTPTVLVRFITAPNAEAARTQGAIQNIAEGNGTPTDVAKFLRDTRQTLEDLKAQGVPVEGTLAEKGIGLSRLAPDLFQKVATGKIDEAVGVGIGGVTADPDMQRTAVAVIAKSGKRLTEKEAADVARQIVAEGSENVSQETLFGTEQDRVPLYVEKAQLAGAIQRRLESDKRLFSYVTKGTRAQELGRAGSTINVEKSAAIAAQSAQLGEVFRQLFTRKGAVSDALTEGARRLTHGDKPQAVADAIYEGIRAEIQAAFSGGKEARVSGDQGDAGRHEETGRAPTEEVSSLDPHAEQRADLQRQIDELEQKLKTARTQGGEAAGFTAPEHWVDAREMLGSLYSRLYSLPEAPRTERVEIDPNQDDLLIGEPASTYAALRARLDQLAARKKKGLDEYALSGSSKAAARAAGVKLGTWNHWRDLDPDFKAKANEIRDAARAARLLTVNQRRRENWAKRPITKKQADALSAKLRQRVIDAGGLNTAKKIRFWGEDSQAIRAKWKNDPERMRRELEDLADDWMPIKGREQEQAELHEQGIAEEAEQRTKIQTELDPQLAMKRAKMQRYLEREKEKAKPPEPESTDPYVLLYRAAKAARVKEQDLFGYARPDEQESLFDEDAGKTATPKSNGTFQEKAAAAREKAAFLRKQLDRMGDDPKFIGKTGPIRAEIAELERVANFTEKLRTEEITLRADGDEAPVVDGQGKLLEERNAYEESLSDFWKEQGPNGRRQLLRKWAEMYRPDQFPGTPFHDHFAKLSIDDLPQYVKDQIGVERVNQVIAMHDVGVRENGRDPDQQDLFFTYGTAEKQEAAVKQVIAGAGKYVTLSDAHDHQGRPILSSQERKRNVQTGAAARRTATVTLEGKIIKGVHDLAQLLYPFRSPEFEQIHIILTDAVGKILSHTIDSSGVVDFSMLPLRMARSTARLAKKIGATHVHLAHNHPSGDPSSSREDRQVTSRIAYELQRRGLTLVDHVITNHKTMTWLKPEGEFTRQAGIIRGKLTRGEKLPYDPPPLAEPTDWTQGHGENLASPQHLVQLTGGPRGGDIAVVYVTAQGGTLALEPRRGDDLWNLQSWLPQSVKDHGASSAAIVFDPTEHGDAVHEILDSLENSPHLAQHIYDVVSFDGKESLRTKYPDALAEFERKGFTIPPGSKRILGEPNGEGYGERSEEKGSALPGAAEGADDDGGRRVRPEESADDARREEGSALPSGSERAADETKGVSEEKAGYDRAVDEDLDEGLLPGYESDLKPHETPFSAATPAVQAIRAKIGLPPLPRPPRALIEISRDLADQAGVPLRQGRFNAGVRQALGVFFPHAETTRVRRYDDLSTVAHEVGHFTSKKHLGNPANKGAAVRGAMPLTKGMLKELREMGKRLYGNRQPQAGYGEEGIAEAFKFFVTDPPRLTAEAPEFAVALDAKLATNPTLHRALLQAREDYSAHKANPATARADALISVNERVRNRPSIDEIVRQTVDDLDPFRKAVAQIGGTDDITKHAYVLARLTRGDAGIAEEMNQRGVVDFATRARVTKGIIPVLRSIPPEKLQAFRRYLLAERALELWDRNIDVGMTKADATSLKKTYEAEFGAQAKELWAHSDALLKYRHDAGLLTDAEYKAIADRNKRRVPLYVVFDDAKDNAGTGKGWGKKWGRNSSGINTIKGSGRRKIDPLESILQDTYKTVEQANRHHVAATLFKLGLEKEGAGRVVEEVEHPKERMAVNVPRVLNQLVDLGIVDPNNLVLTGNGSIAVVDSNGKTVDLDGLVLEQWDPREHQNAKDEKDMVIPVVIDGTRHWLQIQDPKLFDALNALGKEHLPGWARVFGAPARALRAGATLTPEFVGRNPFKDIFSASTYTRSTNPVDAVPGVIFAKGLFHFLKADDVFQRWRLEGGDNVAQLAIDRREIQTHIEHVTRNFNKVARDLVIHPLDTLRLVSAAMENATRVGEYSVVEKSRLKRGDTPRQSSIAAALSSRDVTIDFARGGVAAKSINQIIAFFNANLQGTDKLIQEHRRRPGTIVMRAFAGITIPSLVLFAMQHDDPDYRKLPRWRRSLCWNWVQRDTNGKLQHIWSWPKPFELGILYGTLPEAIAEWWLEHDTAGFKAFADAAIQGFTPGVVPTAFLPLIENWANKSFFTSRKIVPANAEKREPAYQTREYTGEAARALGEAVNYSPAKIENLVQGWWGGLGRNYALPAANAATRVVRNLEGKEPSKRPNPVSDDRLTDVPLVKGFMAHPPSGGETEQVDELYSKYEKADQVRQSYKGLVDAGRRAEAHDYAVSHRAELAAMRTADSPQGTGRLRDAYNRLEKVRDQRAEILRDDKLSEPEKKRRVRILDDRMVRIAEQGLAAVK